MDLSREENRHKLELLLRLMCVGSVAAVGRNQIDCLLYLGYTMRCDDNSTLNYLLCTYCDRSIVASDTATIFVAHSLRLLAYLD